MSLDEARLDKLVGLVELLFCFGTRDKLVGLAELLFCFGTRRVADEEALLVRLVGLVESPGIWRVARLVE